MSKYLWSGLFAVGLLATACGGADKDSADNAAGSGTVTSDRSASTAPDGPQASATGDTKEVAPNGAPIPDACALISKADAASLVGADVPGKPVAGDPASKNAASVCIWGELGKEAHLVGLQVYSPALLFADASGYDPLEQLVAASKEQIPNDIGENGRLLDDLGLIPGGGGIGKSVAFTKGEFKVVLGVTGDDVDAKTLESTAQKIADQI